LTSVFTLTLETHLSLAPRTYWQVGNNG
jgi:hypothetical protein